MHVIVLGAGVVGVTTAYYLAKQGCRVTVIGRADHVGDGASFANGGQLSYSFTDALAKPGFVTKIPKVLLHRDPGLRVSLSPALLAWGLRFLRECTSKQAASNTVAVLQRALRSAQLLAELRNEVAFEFDHRKAGKLVLLASADELAAARASRKLKRQHGCHTEILTKAEAIAIEPALAHMRGDILGAVYSQEDEVADAQKFTSELGQWLESQGTVEFRLASTAKELLLRHQRIDGVVVDDDVLEADAFVVCMGVWSQRLLRSVGVDPHVFPVRGYSITLPPGDAAPSVSITALKHHMVFSRINGFVRVAGFADFTGFDARGDGQRIDTLLALARDYAPDAADYDNAAISSWTGLRPMTPNGRPRIGATDIDRLFVNTGHGMLGWTLACASGYDTAQAVTRVH